MLTIYGSNNNFLPRFVDNLKHLFYQKLLHIHTAVDILKLQNLIDPFYKERQAASL